MCISHSAPLLAVWWRSGSGVRWSFTRRLTTCPPASGEHWSATPCLGNAQGGGTHSQHSIHRFNNDSFPLRCSKADCRMTFSTHIARKAHEKTHRGEFNLCPGVNVLIRDTPSPLISVLQVIPVLTHSVRWWSTPGVNSWNTPRLTQVSPRKPRRVWAFILVIYEH